MTSQVPLVVNGKPIRVTRGEVLLEAVLGAGIAIPHDCSTGQCETCRVRVYDGEIDAMGTQRGDTVLACQARVSGNAIIEFDAVPVPTKIAGRVSAIQPLSPDVLEVTVSLARDFTYLPGQYVKCMFAGSPARDYSPTLRSDGTANSDELILQIRRIETGVVSAQLGNRIAVGHKVSIHGPFGSAFHRPGEGRIVLVAAGTGWAPIWAIARASRYREPRREMVVVAGARDPRNLYMRDALAWLAGTGVGHVVATASGQVAEGVRAGRPTDHLPGLRDSDVVHVAGSPEMVAAVEQLCREAGATCHADAFVASPTRQSFKDKVFGLFFRGGSAEPSSPSASS
ncbi:MAG TPA: 2Fe-2S iron-sulfur cluster-binding protein [Bosea sp. (in: a-proteobacteria)]|jgi:3-phenylpropionate/trans-cinnamate dioxygenase ferredoxin reductase subunit|uniref:2Fe-2S iron-sulfur cluster-binding protein n=1 Tax=Bosea sp. (in: a-proteobacteria) TaxID=1871050 RepID=UPI002E0F4009|nr:2Fe-2S iron-sulfur cluster-binding protein [Bosea sp. (in: a-proteobacteria)]